MNHAKIILVGVISAFVAITTSVLGITGTIIGSVISSVLYNVLSEALDKPVSDSSFNSNFEWGMAYVFPLIVIALIQLLLILAFLDGWNLVPHTFLTIYLSLQNIVNNNLYRVLGLALLVMSVYPFILKPEHVNKVQGMAIAGVGLVFLARGFVDLNNRITDIYDDVFIYFDFPIAVIAFTILAIIICGIIISAYKSRKEADEKTKSVRVHNPENHKEKVVRRSRGRKPVRNSSIRERIPKVTKDEIIVEHSQTTKRPEDDKSRRKVINQSSDNIHFESNDLLDDYKR